MGNIFGGAKTPKAEPVPTPEESEGTARKKQQERAKRLAAQETLLSTSTKEEQAKLLG